MAKTIRNTMVSISPRALLALELMALRTNSAPKALLESYLWLGIEECALRNPTVGLAVDSIMREALLDGHERPAGGGSVHLSGRRRHHRPQNP